MFSLVSRNQLERSAKESFGVAQPLFGLTDRCSKIFAARWYSQRTNFSELLTIPLYVFGDDRQSCRDRVVHVASLARLIDKSRLPRWRCCRYRGQSVHSVTVRDDLRALVGYHSPQVDVRIRLNTNEAPTPPPAAWRDAFAAELSRVEWHRYPDRSASALRAAIAESHDVRPDQVFAANGSNEVLQTLLLAYAGHGRCVATFEPTYQLHGHIARLTGATVIEGERAPDFSLDVAAAVGLITEHRPAVTFLCSPNNPTGLVEPASNVATLLAAEPGLLVVDEAYGQYAEWSALTLIDESTPLVVTRTFSKTWSMAASRLGYLVGPSWLVAELEIVALPYHLDAAKQIAGRLALQFTDEMDARVEQIVAERERVSAGLRALDIDVFPSGANFVLFRPCSHPAKHVWQELLDRSILIRDCSGWPRLTDCLRVTIGTSDENDEFLTAMSEVVQ
jgi:histidinol-phosphate aminotransferase